MYAGFNKNPQRRLFPQRGHSYRQKFLYNWKAGNAGAVCGCRSRLPAAPNFARYWQFICVLVPVNMHQHCCWFRVSNGRRFSCAAALFDVPLLVVCFGFEVWTDNFTPPSAMIASGSAYVAQPQPVTYTRASPPACNCTPACVQRCLHCLRR